MLDTVNAEDVLNVFRGLPEGTVSPSSVTLAVSNGSGAPNQATEVSRRLGDLGYNPSVAADATKTRSRTVVRYAPGMQAHADQVARQLIGGADLEVDTSLSGAVSPVVLVTGTDFTGVLQEATAPTASTSTTAGTSSSTSSTGPVTTVDPSEVTESVGYVVGDPPAGVTCG